MVFQRATNTCIAHPSPLQIWPQWLRTQRSVYLTNPFISTFQGKSPNTMSNRSGAFVEIGYSRGTPWGGLGATPTSHRGTGIQRGLGYPGGTQRRPHWQPPGCNLEAPVPGGGQTPNLNNFPGGPPTSPQEVAGRLLGLCRGTPREAAGRLRGLGRRPPGGRPAASWD